MLMQILEKDKSVLIVPVPAESPFFDAPCIQLFSSAIDESEDMGNWLVLAVETNMLLPEGVLPEEIWARANLVDRGDILINNRRKNGLSYLRQWKRAERRPRLISGEITNLTITTPLSRNGDDLLLSKGAFQDTLYGIEYDIFKRVFSKDFEFRKMDFSDGYSASRLSALINTRFLDDDPEPVLRVLDCVALFIRMGGGRSRFTVNLHGRYTPPGIWSRLKDFFE